MLNRISEFISYLPSGYVTGQRDARAMMWMAPFHSMSVIRTFLLPKWLGGKGAVFTSSGSQKADLNERNRDLRAPVWQRLKVTIWDCQCYMHLVFIAFCPGCGRSQNVLGLYRPAESHGQRSPPRASYPCLLATAHLADVRHVMLGANKPRTFPAFRAEQTGVAGAGSSDWHCVAF